MSGGHACTYGYAGAEQKTEGETAKKARTHCFRVRSSMSMASGVNLVTLKSNECGLK